MLIPKLILRQLYTYGSLKNTPNGIQFTIKNRLADARLTKVHRVLIDQQEIPLKDIFVENGNGVPVSANDISPNDPIPFPLRQLLTITIDIPELRVDKHQISIHFNSSPFGKLKIEVYDAITSQTEKRQRIPRDDYDDYSENIISDRQKFIQKHTGKAFRNIYDYSFDARETKGNIENFVGVAQVPIGIAGPVKINGEYAKGEFIVPMATTEGTLIASYNRGIKVLNICGGVKVTVVDDAMQRAPVFVFEDARNAREFVGWVQEHLRKIRKEAEATSSVAKLIHIDAFLSNKFAYLRFNYTTGDAAGQNMVGRATFAACSWIIEKYVPGKIKNFYLESNLATDKKTSQINVIHSRGKRVIAEAVLDRNVLIQHLRVEPEKLNYHANIANIGAFMSGANNNGAHSPNAITAIFIATGQDVANVSESSAGILYTELTPEKDLYISLTIPSLIVATYGGGTGLPTQRECLEMMACYGKNKVNKLAEIIGGVALAGEISLGSAISSSDWVSSHETYGRNR